MESALKALHAAWLDQYTAEAKQHDDNKAAEIARHQARVARLNRRQALVAAILTLVADCLPAQEPHIGWAEGNVLLEWDLPDKNMVVSLSVEERTRDPKKDRITVQTIRSELHPDAVFEHDDWCDDNTLYREYFQCSVDDEKSTRKACGRASAALVAQFEEA